MSAGSGSYYSSLSEPSSCLRGLLISFANPVLVQYNKDQNNFKKTMAIFLELPVLGSEWNPRELARPISPSKAKEILASKKPEWLKIRPPGGESYQTIKGL